MKMSVKLKQITTLAIFLVLFFMLQSGFSAPAFPEPIDYELPDGSVITIQLKGDEFVNWQETPDGYTMLFNSEGFLEYAVEDKDGDLKLSGMRAHSERNRTEKEKMFLSNQRTRLRFSPRQIDIMNEVRSAVAAMEETLPQLAQISGTFRMPIILVEFQDKRFTKTKQEFEMLFNQLNHNTGGLTGSLRDYFKANSYGKLDLQVDVFGPVRVSGNVWDYGGNNGLGEGAPKSGGHMASEAIQLAIAGGADFRNYPHPDRANEAIAAHIIFAGHGKEAGAPLGQIWSHASSANPNVWTNGPRSSRTTSASGWLRVRDYSCSPELRGNSGTNTTHIGVIAHEIGHSLLKLPDFYDTDGNTARAVDLQDWDIMAGGCWLDNGRTPALLSAYPRIDLGWATEKIVTHEEVTIPNPNGSECVVYRINTTTNNEYFLLENRQKTGWDSYIYAGGLLIYHVDRNAPGWSNNRVNAVADRRGYAIEQADCTVPNGCLGNNSYNRNRDVFPRSGKTSFTDETVPGSKSRLGANTAKPITQITHNTSAGTISFNIQGAGIKKKAPEIIFPSITEEIIYSPTQKLLDISLNGKGSGDGIFAWKNPNTIPTIHNDGYEIIFTPKDQENYDYTGIALSKVVSLNMKKAQIEKPSAPNETILTYNGNDQTIDIIADSVCNISENTANEVGNYEAVVALKDTGNYKWINANITNDVDTIFIAWTIEKAQIFKPEIPANTIFEHDGKIKILDIAEHFAYEISGHVEIEVGTYYAIVKLADTSNYKWVNSEIANDVDEIFIAWSIELATPISNYNNSDGKYGIKLTQNPVSDKAEISVVLPNNEKIADTKIVVYDMIGNIVFVGVDYYRPTTWNLRNSVGRFVANGTYLIIAEIKDTNGKTYIYNAKIGVKR